MKKRKKFTGYRTVLVAAALAVASYAQSDVVSQWISNQPFNTSFALFAVIALLRIITTTPIFEDK